MKILPYQQTIHSENLSGKLLAAWIVLLLLVFLVYQPGLSGSFVFDDFPNIVESGPIILKSLSASEISRVALSGNAGPLLRPVSILSFSFNIYSGGMNPWHLKLTNIFIHVLCTIGTGLLASRFFTALIWKKNCHELSTKDKDIIIWGSWLAAAIWGLHPLNLTSVLYIVQRMTSLAALFGIIAAAIYINARMSSAFTVNIYSSTKRVALQYSAVVFFIALSVFSKENGILFIPLIILIELYLFEFKINGKTIHPLNLPLDRWVKYSIILLAICTVIWIAPEVAKNIRVPNRDFSVYERLLTQSRAILFYLSEFFFPQISRMSLYHDDIEISRSIFQPLTTFWSISFLILISFLCYAFRKKYPLITFSWLWFIFSHSMESSFYPLELVHEHRNYFATTGFCLAMSWFAVRFFLNSRSKLRFFLVPYLILLSLSTSVRALEWSSPFEFSAMEASRHPLSMRANYQLAGDLLSLAEQADNKSLVLEEARSSFLAAVNSRSKSVSPYFGLLAVEFSLAKVEHRDPYTEEIIKSLIANLKEYPGEASTAAHIDAFIRCQNSNICSLNDMDALAIITAPVENPTLPAVAKGEILKLAAEYSISRANDWNFAQNLIEEAISYFDTASTRIVYSQVLRIKGNLKDSQDQLSIAKNLDRLGQYSTAIERENNLLKNLTSQDKTL